MTLNLVVFVTKHWVCALCASSSYLCFDFGLILFKQRWLNQWRKLQLNVELIIPERNLLSVGYKNVIGARRASWRILSSIEQKEESRGHEENAKRVKDYRTKVEDELSKICYDILAVVDKHLVPSATSGEYTVFYYKMLILILTLKSNRRAYNSSHINQFFSF